jgi:hypothetical protein
MAKEIVDDLPISLGVTGSALSRYDRTTFAADYAIGQLPWIAATSDEMRVSRVTTRFQRDRLDQGTSAGEQSLSNWWLRSATSWHRGAGITFYDADTEDLYRFRDSHNVDVWERGKLSLLPATTRPYSAAAASSPETFGGGAWFIANSNVYACEADGDVVDVTAFSATPQVLCTDGANAFVAASNGIHRIKPDYTSTKIYDAPGGSWTVQAIGYVKDRIIVCAQITDALPMRVFELGRNPSSPSINLVTDSVFEFESTELSFKGVAEATGAILVGVTIGARSTVMSFGLDTSTPGTVALREPVTVAALPVGETLNCLRSYLNTYIALGTSKGLRIATESQGGEGFTYGPLVLSDDIEAVTFDGGYVYTTRAVTKGGAKGLWRVDLGTEVGESFAYASDLSTSTSTPTGVALVGTTGLMLVTAGDGCWVESASVKAATGEISSGAIRYGTTERKQVVSILSRLTVADGAAQFTVVADNGTNGSFIRTGNVLTEDSSLAPYVTPASEFELTITLSKGSSTGPTVEEWQLRAQPAPQRSRTITIPVQCRPQETDSRGNVLLAEPHQRLRALERMEASGQAVLFQDFSTGEERVCIITAVQYEQMAPPTVVDGFSGIVTIQLQTIDSEELN